MLWSDCEYANRSPLYTHQVDFWSTYGLDPSESGIASSIPTRGMDFTLCAHFTVSCMIMWRHKPILCLKTANEYVMIHNPAQKQAAGFSL
jgi:hypothetical protein